MHGNGRNATCDVAERANWCVLTDGSFNYVDCNMTASDNLISASLTNNASVLRRRDIMGRYRRALMVRLIYTARTLRCTITKRVCIRLLQYRQHSCDYLEFCRRHRRCHAAFCAIDDTDIEATCLMSEFPMLGSTPIILRTSSFL